jgi:hypothetical protein
MSNTKAIDVVAAIHKRVTEQAASYATAVALEDWSNDLSKLHGAYNTVYCARNLVGSVPQLPHNFLGWMGNWIIAAAQRLLFWYTPQIRYFNEATTTTLNRLCALEEREFQTFLAMAERVEALERETRLLKAAQAEVPCAATPLESRKSSYTLSPINTSDFYFRLQSRFQSNVAADKNRLEMYRSAISNLDPKAPAGTWLDIGCGRGKWLRLARAGGYEAIGLDTSPDAIQLCREDGFDVRQADALEFLQSSPDESFAIVSAFHVLEHCECGATFSPWARRWWRRCCGRWRCTCFW